MNVRHIIGIFSPEHGGPVVSLCNYVRGQVTAGCRVSVRTLEGYPGFSPAVRLEPSIDQRVFPVGWPYKSGRSAALASFLRQESPPDIYHLHGAWLQAMRYGYNEARRHRRPYLVQINGAYQHFELRRKPLRKRLVRVLFQDRILHDAPCLHVNSVREAREIRQLGFRSPIVVIPAGFDCDAALLLSTETRDLCPWPEVESKKFILYLGRIHANKGIELLLEAWRELCRDYPDYKLLIVGTGEAAYLDQFRKMIALPNLAGRCIWKGFVTEQEKAWCYRNARFYCLPSFTENFGNTVQEALGFGTPVVTTTETPWVDLESIGCGWIAEPESGALHARLSQALKTSEERLLEMGITGAAYIQRDFSLDSVIRKQIATYQWLLGGPQPRGLIYSE